MSQAKTSKKRSWLRFVLYLLFVLTLFLIGGFLAFARHVSVSKPAPSIGSADGIVVWTGKGGDRLKAAGKLLQSKQGERLLISGVNKALSSEDVYALLDISKDKGECCVDIDYNALDTIGNARETHNWLNSMGYEHIILVTSAYHMPRAKVEIGALSGRIRITPYPVVNTSGKPWYKDKTRRRRLVQEYSKLLLTYLRQAGSQKQREAPELPNMTETIGE